MLHAGPSVARFSWVALHVTPSLSGCGRPDHVAITFDDGPDPGSTPVFLDRLDAVGWKATFFMLGTMVRRSPSVARDVAARGHEIAVHGDEHRSMLRRTPGSTRDDVERARDTIADACGVTPEWFRPPYGALTLSSVLAARSLGLRTVLWTAWGKDWRAEATPESVTSDVLAGHFAGGTVLLHDADATSAPGSWRSALGALDRLADAFAERGLVAGALRDHGVRGAGARSSRPAA